MRKSLVYLIVITLVSCGPTATITKSWFEIGTHFTPDATTKTLVVAMVKDETSRRVIEDQLVKRIKTSSVASYTMLTPEMIQAAKPEALEKFIVDGGFTHIVLMRLADMEHETYYVPGTTTGFYGGYGMYYGYGAGYYSNPGYYTTDKNYYVETTLYSVTPNKLLWTGTTKSVNPSKVDKAVNQIADLVVDKMTSQGFLVRKK
jgi:hypothetical protein